MWSLLCALQGIHGAEFSITRQLSDHIAVGLARADFNLTGGAEWSQGGCGYMICSGCCRADGAAMGWAGQEPAGQGDTIGLLLDCEHGCVTIYKNSRRLGRMVAPGQLPPGHGPLCWAVSLHSGSECVGVANIETERLQQLVQAEEVWRAAQEQSRATLLSSSDVRGADLSGLALRGTDLSGRDLSGCDLSYCDLSGCTAPTTHSPGSCARECVKGPEFAVS